MEKLPNEAFTLRQGVSNSFSDRLQGIFDTFDNLEKEHNERAKLNPKAPLKIDDDVYEPIKRPAEDSNPLQKEEFKRPRNVIRNAIIPRNRSDNYRSDNSINKPGYVKNPKKWKQYDLSDVSNDDMTEQTNSQTAHAFIQKLRQDRMKQIEEDKVDLDSDVEFKFKKPSVAKAKATSKKEALTNKAVLSHLSDSDEGLQDSVANNNRFKKKKSRSYRKSGEDED